MVPLPADEQRIMSDHIEIGRRYPEITINTAYSFGLDDQEFVVSFEADEPDRFLDWSRSCAPPSRAVRAARHADLHLRRDVRGERLDALDGTATARSEPALA